MAQISVQLFAFLHKLRKIDVADGETVRDMAGNSFNPSTYGSRGNVGNVVSVSVPELTPVSYQYGTMESKL